MKEWNKVLLGSIGVLALLFVADRVVGALWEKTYKHSRYGIFHRQEYCLHKSDDNILTMVEAMDSAFIAHMVFCQHT